MNARPDIDRGIAGASARREGERRRASRERGLRDRHPRIGGLLFRLQADQHRERRWDIGASAEEEVAAYLERRCPDVVFLHDRRIPGSRANIDHIAVASNGIWVIDTKGHRGRVVVRHRLFADDQLLIAGRDVSDLTGSMSRQVRAVETALGPLASAVPVHCVVCMARGDLPAGGQLHFNKVPVQTPRRLARQLRRGRRETSLELNKVVGDLAAALRSA